MNRNYLVLPLAIIVSFGTGCATVAEPTDPFLVLPFEMPASVELVDNDIAPLVSGCENRLLRRDGPELHGALESTSNIVSPNDHNGFRDSLFFTFVRSEGESSPVEIEIFESENCNIVQRIALDSSDSVQWDGRVGDSGLKDGLYVARAVSADSQRTGATLPIVLVGEDDTCDVPGAPVEWIYEERVSRTDDGKSVILKRPAPVHLCIEAKTSGGDRLLPNIRVNEATYASQSTMQSHSAMSFGVDSYARDHTVTITDLSGDIDLRIGVLPVQELRPTAQGDDSGLEFIPPPDCIGRLYGFEHPFRADPPPKVERQNIAVKCVRRYLVKTVHYVQDPITGEAIAVRKSQVADAFGIGLTDSLGRFEISIPDSEYRRIGVVVRQPTSQRAAWCLDHEQCGRESRSVVKFFNTPDEFYGIFNVPDLAVGGLVARLVTNGDRGDDEFRQLNELVDPNKGWSGRGKPNDLPIVVHEAFDPLLEDGTNQLTWFLNGQIVDHRRLDKKGLANSPCDQPIRGPCLGCKWTVGCDNARVAALDEPGSLANEPFRCHAPNVLLQFVGNGYDVWLVDSVRFDASIYEIAAAALPLYQQILDYGGPDDDRQLALAGLSLGGVMSRVALRSWEVLEQRKQDGNNNPLVLGGSVTTPRPQDLTHSPEKVSLFLSFDAPHLGARIPLAFQAYVKDKDFRGGPRFPSLLNSTPASELLKEFVRPNTDTVCWGKIDDKIKDCTIKHPLSDNSDLSAIVNNNLVELQDHSIEFFASLPPGEPIPTGFSTGLPRTIPSVSIANGSLTANPAPVSDTVFDIDFDLITTEFRHQIKDALQQPLGSGLDTFCAAKELESESELVSISELLYADCRDNTGFLGFGNRLFCGIGAVIGTLGSGGLTALIDAGVSPDIQIPMRPRGDGTGQYPTFIETQSALLVRPRLQLHNVPWIDYSTRPVSQSHFSIDDEQCRFVMYHVDGHMKGDKDGWPACFSDPAGSCLAGGRQPGSRIDQRNRWQESAERFCDPNDNDPRIIPLEIQLEKLWQRNSVAILE